MSLTDPTRTIPTGLATDEFALRPIRASDASRDYTAVMETRVDLRIWEQSSWPEDTFTVDANREDLAGLEQRHEERRAYTYTVIDPADTECLGCVYIFPITATFLTKATVRPVIENAQWESVDAVVYFWVRESRIASGMEDRLLSSIREWLDGDWVVQHAVFVTSEQFSRQVTLLDEAGLHREFELREPGKPDAYLAYT